MNEALRRRLESLEVVRGGLPEEHLFYRRMCPTTTGRRGRRRHRWGHGMALIGGRTTTCQF